MGPADADLWTRSRAGDRDAFGALFERHAKEVYNSCFRRIGSWATAEDMLSVVFIEAWRRRDQNLPPDKVLPWLYGIATNVVRNQRRSERRYSAALNCMPAARPKPDFGGMSDERVDDQWQAQGALNLLRKLPQREQDAFVLCAWMELSYEDAAIALRVPVGTVRSRLSRARTRLRELDPGSGHPAAPAKPAASNTVRSGSVWTAQDWIATPCLLAALTFVLARSGGRGWWVLAAVTVFVTGQSVVYLPRARRAYNR